MSARNIEVFCISLVLVAVLTLASRPYFPSFYDRMYGIDAGGWVMYRYDLASEADLRLVADEEEIPLDAEQYIWHGAFANSPHPHYSEAALRAFMAELSAKPDIRALIAEHGATKMTLDLVLVKNKREWKTISVERALD